jgi:hypothetical protein
MLDDLREKGSDMEFLEEEMDRPGNMLKPDPNIIWGMTPGQRFVIAVMIFLMTVMISAFCLLVTGSVSLPFLY